MWTINYKYLPLKLGTESSVARCLVIFSGGAPEAELKVGCSFSTSVWSYNSHDDCIFGRTNVSWLTDFNKASRSGATGSRVSFLFLITAEEVFVVAIVMWSSINYRTSNS